MCSTMRDVKPILTSYLAKVVNLDRDKYEPIFIASQWPKNQKPQFKEFKLLAPNLKLIGGYIRKEINQDEYTIQYNTMLTTFHPIELYNELCNLAGSKIPVLICYENPDKFCHRHLVSKWFRHNGFSSEELIF